MTVHAVQRPTGPKIWWGLAGFAAVVIVVAVVGSFAAGGAADKYGALEQPSWAPPSWVFGPVWTVLYAMIAVSGWLVWRKTGAGKEMLVFGAQLLLNAFWTPLFFAAGLRGLAFAEIAVLWVLIGINIVMFWRISQPAAWLLVPYWAWVTFASALNFSVWQLN
jgi:benzodiazapine receptor